MLVIIRMLYWLNFSHKIGKESTTGRIGQESFIKLRNFFQWGYAWLIVGFWRWSLMKKKYPTYRKPQCKEFMLKCIHVRISIYKANPGCPSFITALPVLGAHMLITKQILAGDIFNIILCNHSIMSHSQNNTIW